VNEFTKQRFLHAAPAGWPASGPGDPGIIAISLTMRGNRPSTFRAYNLRARCISGLNTSGVAVTAISFVSTRSTQADHHSLKTIALFCCFGLVASFGLMALGVDLGANWL
jgi:hypothetical protein